MVKAGGLSLERIFELFPNLKERLGSSSNNIVAAFVQELGAKGVAVVIEAEHSCMTCRGVKKPGSVMVTSAVLGLCRTSASTRAEVMALLHK